MKKWGLDGLAIADSKLVPLNAASIGDPQAVCHELPVFVGLQGRWPEDAHVHCVAGRPKYDMKYDMSLLLIYAVCLTFSGKLKLLSQ